MATKTITIQGLTVEVNAPYEAGHQLTEAEAKALNQVRAENIRNNCAKIVADAKGDAEELSPEAEAEVRAKIAERDAQYEFTLANAGGTARVVDPVERAALSIAREAVREAARRQNKRILKKDHEGEVGANDITYEAFQEKIASVAAQDDVMRLARKRVKENGGVSVSLDEAEAA